MSDTPKPKRRSKRPLNTFSSLPPEQQAEELQAAESVVLPWEREGYVRPSKPPGVQP